MTQSTSIHSPSPAAGKPDFSGLFTIAAGQDFAAAFVRGILHRVDDVQELAQWQIYLPSQRACQSVQSAFLDVTAGRPLILPQLLALGEEDEISPLLLEGLMDADDPLLHDSIAVKDRQFVLARLISSMKIGGFQISQPQALLLADDLASLLDQIRQAGHDISELPALIPDEFSAHWKDVAQFLEILFSYWPAILKDRGMLDPLDKKLRLQELRCKSWLNTPPATPIVIAGSTGSLPSTAQMMQTVLTLPKGMVILPGLSTEITDTDDQKWIAEDVSHPQHQLFRLCAYLEYQTQNVKPWHQNSFSETEMQRRKLWREVFRPYQQTNIWRRMDKTELMLSAQAVTGLSMICARDVHHEADIIAALMRKTLQQPEKTALLVTPDRKLARSVCAALLRWGIEIEDSAGQPLSQTPAGSYLDLIAGWTASEGSADSLLALAKHQHASGGLAKADFNHHIRQIERNILRNVLPADNAAGIAAQLEGEEKYRPEAQFYADHILTPLSPLTQLLTRPVVSLAELSAAHGQAAENLAQNEFENEAVADLWSGADGKSAAQLLSDLAQYGQNIMISPADYAACFYQLSHAQTVRTSWRSHPRLAILGTVEARMQSADLMILGGLNEGVWPPEPDHSPWVNQQIREQLGLPHKRWRAGLSAHDFFMAAHHAEIVLSRSETADGASNIASRFWQRLEAVLAATSLDSILSAHIPADIQAGFDALYPDVIQPVPPPRPCPELSARPRRFWATDFDVLITDPYAIYAKYILQLRPLDAVAKQPDAALRGSLYHDCLADFIHAYPAGSLPENALEELEQIAQSQIKAFSAQTQVRRFWQHRFRHIARWFIEQEQQLRLCNQHALTETRGFMTLALEGGDIVIGAKADRLDKAADGSWTIIDYKTGQPPTKSQVEKGRKTQLLIEAFIAQQGGFEGQNAGEAGQISRLEYWHLSGKAASPAHINDVTPTQNSFEDYLGYLTVLLARFDDPETPYESEPDSTQRPRFSSYRHLARVREWRKHDVDDDDR